MLVIMRFRVAATTEGAFEELAPQAEGLFAASKGCLGAELARNLDDPELWALVTSWVDVRSYRQALSAFDAKVFLAQLAAWSVDEPSAYDSPGSLGENIPRSR